MSTVWYRGRLGDVCRVVPGYAFKSSDWRTAGIPVVKIKNITGNNSVDLATTDCVPESLLTQRLQKFVIKDGDILVAMTGATAGKVGRVRTNRILLLNQRVAKIVAVDADPDFIWAVVSSQEYQEKFFYLADGAAQPNMSGSQIEGVDVPLPPRPAQQRIAGILSAYDELIENNQQRIRILESMASALYREWFVHFRFPGHEHHPRVASTLGEIPHGWKVNTAKNILARRPAGSVYREADVKPEGAIPVIDQSTSELLGFHDNAPDHSASSALPIAIFGDHTCKMQLLIEPFSVGPNVVPFVASQDMPTAYVFYAVNSLVHTQEYKRHWIPLSAKEVVVADRMTAKRFSSLIRPMLVTQETHRKAIRNLRRTRDLLLPRLLSGQIEARPPEP
ncbi:restriction endonuclease subunit S [Accumulibacter sp.]|uniref:restriction endonuclease subunit S n=1 Tax=Accumulibacter sp. TaxID=2053492 RepID=UPI002608901B|nr:restriction endonuclease subunit S [Accumulibacter sp.]